MTEVFQTKNRLDGSQGREITVEMVKDGFKIWDGEEVWTTVSSLLEVMEEIEEIAQYHAARICGSYVSW